MIPVYCTPGLKVRSILSGESYTVVSSLGDGYIVVSLPDSPDINMHVSDLEFDEELYIEWEIMDVRAIDPKKHFDATCLEAGFSTHEEALRVTKGYAADYGTVVLYECWYRQTGDKEFLLMAYRIDQIVTS